jgi:hypothetical protein
VREFLKKKTTETPKKTPIIRGLKGTLQSDSVAGRVAVLQRSIGNRGVERLCRSDVLQAKLTIGQPNDIYEQEADRVAEQVMRMPEPDVQMKPGRPFAKGPSCGEEEGIIQSKEAAGQTPDVTLDTESDIGSLTSGGQPLPESSRAFFEPRFGHDFSYVRLRTDAKAAESARAINAQAYTVGHDVVFAAGQCKPGTMNGNRLLAHELTHVVQQQHGDEQGNHIQRALAPIAKKTSAPAIDDKKVQKYIDDALSKNSGDINKAWLDLESQKEENCDPNLTPAIHYMFARHLVKDLHFPGWVVISAILSYSLFKLIGIKIPTGKCPVSESSVDQVLWGIDGVNDGEHK